MSHIPSTISSSRSWHSSVPNYVGNGQPSSPYRTSSRTCPLHSSHPTQHHKAMTRLLVPRGPGALDPLPWQIIGKTFPTKTHIKLSLVLRPPRETFPDQHASQGITAMTRLLDAQGSEALDHLLTEHNNRKTHHIKEENQTSPRQ